MMRKIKILIGIIVFVGIIASLYLVFLKREKKEYSLVKVSRQNIVQEVSETGTIKTGEEINLSFKNSGKIEKIYVKVGDKVKPGMPLAKLDNAQLIVQLAEAQAALEVAQAQYNKLLAGASPEEIKIAETEVKNKQISLNTAKENLNQAYEDALNTLDDSYLKLYNSLIFVNSIQRAYFNSYDQEGAKVVENKGKIENGMTQAKSYLDVAKNNPEKENIDKALLEMKKALNTTYGALAIIRETCEESVYQNKVSSADKASLDTQRTNINTVLINITNSQQNISSMKLSQEAAEGALNRTQDELSELKAPPRQQDIDLYQAKIKQAQAQIDLLKTQIEQASIFSPVEGQITKIQKREGETIQLAVPVLSLISISPFQITADIYEEDIVKVKVGNPVDIKLTVFPDKIFKGKVIAIDPAEKLIEGVVYYEVTIDFEEAPPEIKPGMTADITIKTDSRENVLTVPKSAIEKKDGKIIIQVLKGKEIEKRQIQIGLEGSNDLVEVISGLNEGEELVAK